MADINIKTSSRLALIVFVVLVACSQQESSTAFKQKKIVSVPVSKKKLFVTIQPFSDLSPELTHYVLDQLKIVYPFCELKRIVQLPSFAYYRPRNRYRADSLIAFLGRNTTVNHVTIGLTSKDVSTCAHGVSDWGVMGLGFQPGNACVISTFRLNKQHLRDQLFKVAIHELGHTQGLPHCPEKSCFMADAEGGNPLERETDFCKNCKARLTNKGWSL